MVGANKGYLKTSVGAKRLRFVKNGYDAADESVPPNKVIFDSQDIGSLAILETGTYSWSNFPALSIPMTKVRTWSYGFVPVCVFHWRMNELWKRNALYVEESGYQQLVKPALDGLYVQFNVTNFATYTGTVTLHWTALALDARAS